ncbi:MULTISPECIES: queuosine precursor transporter [Nisaea]|uniref:queuosine precursor transporter n=1 Tax=Nisaea TaxID=390876 RepID=UPI000408FC46|nr:MULTISPECIES: queuosine precursor transporter [Nisaea]
MTTTENAAFSRTGLVAGMSAMGVVVLASNIAVNYPINDWLTWGALIYPIAFLVTDLVNRIFGPKPARKVVYAGFATGVALSLWFADQRIALASGTAFLTAQLLDIWVFDRLRQQSWWKAPVISSLLSSALDTALFFSLAFYATGLPWVTWAIGDYGAKLAMAAVLLVPFRAFISLLPQRFAQEETAADAAQ